MNILFVHRYYPGHYRHLAAAAASRPENRVVFLTLGDPTPDGMGHDERVLVKHCRPPAPGTVPLHPSLAMAEAAFGRGETVLAAGRQLVQSGFNPDVICAHMGFGMGIHLKDAFPDAPILGYCEWYYRAEDGDAPYLAGPLTDTETALIRTRNAPLLLEMEQAEAGVCPMRFQHNRFPPPFRDRITVLHDGIDTARIERVPAKPPLAALSEISDLKKNGLGRIEAEGGREIVTYATRGMERHRCFPEFMRAARLLLEARPDLHIVIAGTGASYYGAGPAEATSFKDELLREFSPEERARCHFPGFLPYDSYLALLKASTVHVYLTVPFVLSWSVLEAMAAGCAVVAANVAPVREVMTDGVEGLLADERSPSAIASRIEELLDRPDLRRDLGSAAQRRIERDYALKKLLPKHLAMIGSIARSGSLPGFESWPGTGTRSVPIHAFG